MKRNHDKDTRLNYTREWVEARSQGLQMVNDMTFLFFQEIECSEREHFPTNIQNLRDIDIRSLPQGFLYLDTRIFIRTQDFHTHAIL